MAVTTLAYNVSLKANATSAQYDTTVNMPEVTWVELVNVVDNNPTIYFYYCYCHTMISAASAYHGAEMHIQPLS